MNKQLLSVIFVLTANAVLLFHAVLPHHHHDSVACFDESKDCPLNPNHHHRNQLCDNSHDDPHNPGLCVLEQVVSVFAKKFIILKPRCPQNNDPVHYQTLFGTRLKLFAGNRSIHKIFVLEPEYLIGYTSYISVSIGLRAPPAV